MRFLSTLLSVAQLAFYSTGCDTMKREKRRPVEVMVAGEYEPETLEGAKGTTRPSRLKGALSSEAGEIEDHLLQRTASPDF
jgi:hypothetical protein